MGGVEVREKVGIYNAREVPTLLYGNDRGAGREKNYASI
jgi:hypothetical protein